METRTESKRAPWHQSRMMWAGILAFIFGAILTVALEDRAGSMGAVFMFAGLICAALWLLRRFFTGR